MNDTSPELNTPLRARGDIPAERICLCCQASFWSDGFGERVCPRCKSTVSWKSSVPSGDGRARRR
ncbi:hypothetical protein [Pararhodobacter sp.]|uniref:hypothetical protein n=1 Tax=Pararhodobacter sp. TaxID=2127056 RepID=UPI002FDCA640